MKKLIVLCFFVFPLSVSADIEIPRTEAEFVQRTIADRAKALNLPVATTLAVAWCESRFRIDARNVNRNGTIDGGIFQVNDVHLPTLRVLGLNRWNYSDNIDFALMLMQKNGFRDWNSSKHCWSTHTLALGGS